MKTYINEKIGRIVIINLKKDELFLESVEEEIKRLNLRNGVLVSGIGALKKVRLHRITTLEDLPTNEYITVEKPIELSSVQGLIIDGEPHFHMTVAEEPGKTYAGHMEYGCTVQYLAEIVILELPDIALCREKDVFGISYIRSKQ